MTGRLAAWASTMPMPHSSARERQDVEVQPGIEGLLVLDPAIEMHEVGNPPLNGQRPQLGLLAPAGTDPRRQPQPAPRQQSQPPR